MRERRAGISAAKSEETNGYPQGVRGGRGYPGSERDSVAPSTWILQLSVMVPPRLAAGMDPLISIVRGERVILRKRGFCSPIP
jgi:hypothetical protein